MRLIGAAVTGDGEVYIVHINVADLTPASICQALEEFNPVLYFDHLDQPYNEDEEFPADEEIIIYSSNEMICHLIIDPETNNMLVH